MSESTNIRHNALSEAYVLHARKYRDTSLILELLTLDEGRISAVARGVRSRNSKVAGHLQPFNRFLVSWFGRGDLKTVKSMDFPFSSREPHGQSLLLGLYVNELLVRLLGKHDAAPGIFHAYGTLLEAMTSNVDLQPILRRFELMLLRELGYGITFEVEAGTGEPVSADGLYRYAPDDGFHRVSEPGSAYRVYRGEQLLRIMDGDFDDAEVNACARHVIRRSFANLLGPRELKSRELFRQIEDLT